MSNEQSENTETAASKALPSSSGSRHVYDKTGRKIEVGDVLKVFHFVGARRKRYYMYKWVLERRRWPNSEFEWLHISHLSAGNVDKCYYEKCDDRQLEHVEIVQGYRGVRDGLSYEDRPKHSFENA